MVNEICMTIYIYIYIYIYILYIYIYNYVSTPKFKKTDFDGWLSPRKYKQNSTPSDKQFE